ncbi:TlpA family protein disulfide reductase [Pontibacter pamirensis]|uniref:TlpA family protein disulfide reductase n=1 Tax=Pontibacter pamirensis TaxID=2562824 RepID=UPI001389C99E|nr:TlpA family protein disulfide reductase [Pontibacter pamirensis]
MKINIELVVLGILYMLLGAFIIVKTDERSFLMLLYTSCLFISMGVIFFGNLYFFYSLFRKGRRKSFLLLNLALLIITYCISAFLFASWMADVYNIELLISHLIHPTVLKENLPLLVFVIFFSFVYSTIKQLVLNRKFILLIKITIYSFAILFITGAAFFIKHQIDLSYRGDEETLFIDNQYSSLNEIVQLPQFRNKVVYVDLWYSSCAPCIKEFQHLANLKAQLKGKDIAYLYLARETSHPNSRQRWKNTIKKYSLQGWHVYMSKQLEEQVWTTILENQQEKVTAAYPRYLLIDKSGGFVSFDANRPSSGRDIVAQIEAIL